MKETLKRFHGNIIVVWKRYYRAENKRQIVQKPNAKTATLTDDEERVVGR